MALEAYYSGLPDSVLPGIQAALDSVYPGTVILEVPVKGGKMRYKAAAADSSVVFVCIDSSTAEAIRGVASDLLSMDKCVIYEDVPSVVTALQGIGADVSALNSLTDVHYTPVSEVDDIDDFDHSDGSIDEDLDAPVSTLPSRPTVTHEVYADSPQNRYEPGTSLIIDNLRGQLDELASLVEDGVSAHQLNELRSELFNTREELVTSRNEVVKLRGELEKSRSSETALESRYNSLQERSSAWIHTESDYKTRINEMQSDIDRLNRELRTAKKEADNAKTYQQETTSNIGGQQRIRELLEEVKTLSSQKDEVNEKLGTVTTKVTSLETENTRLSSELLNLKSDYESKVSRIEELESDLESRVPLDDVSKTLGIYGEISENSGPYDILPLLTENAGQFNKINFLFAGSKEYNAEIYRRFRDLSLNYSNRQIEKGRNSRVLFADFSNDSFSTYVFGTSKSPKNAIEWLTDSAPLRNVIYPATDSYFENYNVSVISLARGRYVNDLSLFGIDWDSKFEELNALGYRVFAYFGDITSSFPRSIYSTYGTKNTPYIHIRGSVSGTMSARSILAKVGIVPGTVIKVHECMELRYVTKSLEWFENNGAKVVIQDYV